MGHRTALGSPTARKSHREFVGWFSWKSSCRRAESRTITATRPWSTDARNPETTRKVSNSPSRPEENHVIESRRQPGPEAGAEACFAQRPFNERAYWPGVSPNARLKTRVKWDWSAKP